MLKNVHFCFRIGSNLLQTCCQSKWIGLENWKVRKCLSAFHFEKEESSNFEQFAYLLDTKEIVDFIGIGVENGHLEINSFSIEI